MATELRKLGAVVEEGADYLRITPPQEQIQAAAIDTYDDHRMAMCFSLASLDGAGLKGNRIRINDPKCVAKPFPDYFSAFADIARNELFRNRACGPPCKRRPRKRFELELRPLRR